MSKACVGTTGTCCTEAWLEQGDAGAYMRLVSSLQYAILMTMVLTIFIKYVLHSVDLQSENPWDNKAVYMLYTELFTGDRGWGLS